MKLNLSKLENLGDERLSFFICTYILSSSFNAIIKTIFPISDTDWSTVSNFFSLLIIITLIIALPAIIKRQGFKLFILEIVFFVLYLISYFTGFAKQDVLFDAAFWTLFVCLPIAVAGISVYNKDTLFKFLTKSFLVEFPFLCIALLSLRYGELGTVRSTYSMTISYMLVLPILFFFHLYFHHNKPINLFFSLFGTVLIVLFGARGPVLCVLFYLLIHFFIQSLVLKKIIYVCLTVIIIGLLIGYADVLIQKINLFLFNAGINSYVLNRLISGNIAESTARVELANYYLDLIDKRPFLGYGLTGGWLEKGLGPHNAFLELYLAFGYFGGTLISLFLIILLLCTLFNKTKAINGLLLILATYVYPQLMLSGGILVNPLCFLFIFLATQNTFRVVTIKDNI